jgi:flagellar L-ring protein FlgH
MIKPCWSSSNSNRTARIRPSVTIVLACLVALASPRGLADSLLVSGKSRAMVADKRAAGVGDILNIVVQETSTAKKENNTKTSKEAGVDASISSFLYSPAASGLLTQKGQMPALKYKSKSNFDGGGSIDNSEKIVARVAVQVTDVLPNGDLVVEGRRQTSFSGESQEAVLRGVVRPADITANNTVFSYNVADVNIKFVSKGAISDSQRKGWFTKFWDKLTPF